MDVPLFGWMSIFLWSDISLTVSPQSPLAAKFSMPFPTQFMLAECSARGPGSPRSLKNRKDSEKLIESRRKTSLCSCAAGAAGHGLINSSGRSPNYFTLIFLDRGSVLSGPERKWLLQMLLPVRATEKGGRFPPGSTCRGDRAFVPNNINPNIDAQCWCMLTPVILALQ